MDNVIDLDLNPRAVSDIDNISFEWMETGNDKAFGDKQSKLIASHIKFRIFPSSGKYAVQFSYKSKDITLNSLVTHRSVPVFHSSSNEAWDAALIELKSHKVKLQQAEVERLRN